MKAMILAAGRGKRMRPLSDVVPKPLLMLKKKSLIEHQIFALKDSGIKDIVINLNYCKDKIQQHLGSGVKYGVNIHYSIEDELLGTGGGVLNALKYLGEDPFVVLSADVYTEYPFYKLQEKLEKLAHIVLVENPEFNQQGDFSLHEGKIIPKKDKTYTYANIGIFHPKIFVNTDIKEKNFPLSKILFSAIEKKVITGELYLGKWFNIGTKKQLLQASAQLIIKK